MTTLSEHAIMALLERNDDLRAEQFRLKWFKFIPSVSRRLNEIEAEITRIDRIMFPYNYVD